MPLFTHREGKPVGRRLVLCIICSVLHTDSHNFATSTYYLQTAMVDVKEANLCTVQAHLAVWFDKWGNLCDNMFHWPARYRQKKLLKPNFSPEFLAWIRLRAAQKSQTRALAIFRALSLPVDMRRQENTNFMPHKKAEMLWDSFLAIVWEQHITQHFLFITYWFLPTEMSETNSPLEQFSDVKIQQLLLTVDEESCKQDNSVGPHRSLWELQ